jgi:hypothetical protein
MGGEYLPDYLEFELEIARVTLESTTQDVTSIRVRPDSQTKQVLYRIVDEYQSEYSTDPSSSREPLTLADLINLIDGAGIALDVLKSNAKASERAPAEWASFVEVSSVIYPDLAKHYWLAVQHWILTASGVDLGG